MSKSAIVRSICMLAAAVALAVSCGEGSIEDDPEPAEGSMAALYHNPTFRNVSVHDPMVTKADDTYYIFGSHLAAAYSDNLLHWLPISGDWETDNPIIPNPENELEEALHWPQPQPAESTWAKSVIELNDQYYMYFSTSSWGEPRSAIALAIADDIKGPYRYEGFVIRSYNEGETNVAGEPYDSSIHPNAIDPHVFFDAEGKLWMVYGSYAGGIFILEMDSETGLPRENESYGTRLTGGNWAAIEGAYVLYHPGSDYYYFMSSYGSLAPNAGYNIRLSRSPYPDGPFFDPSGNDVIEADSDRHSEIAPYGAKLLGNFLFDESRISYLSPGHNSAFYDPQTGKTYAFFHMRWPGSGMSHSVRVHQLILNSMGWLVMTPHRYAGENLQTVSADEIAGTYQYINHGKSIQATASTSSIDVNVSQTIELNPDGSISGAVDGSWELVDDWFAEIRVSERVYHGVFLEQWDEGLSEHVMTFTALSEAGVSIWASRLP